MEHDEQIEFMAHPENFISYEEYIDPDGAEEYYNQN